VIANGRIVGLVASIAIIGAAGTATCTAEVALNNTTTSNALTVSGAPSEQLVGRLTVGCGNASAGNNQSMQALNINVRQGNILCINTSITGTAPAVTIQAFDVLVMEG